MICSKLTLMDLWMNRANVCDLAFVLQADIFSTALNATFSLAGLVVTCMTSM